MATVPKKTPFRKCVGCGEMFPKSQLIRVVRSPQGEIALDKTGKLNGRGAYICDDARCFAACRKAKRLDKAFGASVPESVYLKLEEAVKRGE